MHNRWRRVKRSDHHKQMMGGKMRVERARSSTKTWLLESSSPLHWTIQLILMTSSILPSSSFLVLWYEMIKSCDDLFLVWFYNESRRRRSFLTEGSLEHPKVTTRSSVPWYRMLMESFDKCEDAEDVCCWDPKRITILTISFTSRK